MTSTVSAVESLWLDTPDPLAYPSLSGDTHVDVAILGGGSPA